MGTAEEWQKTLVKRFENYPGSIFNPRRDDWDSSWEQRIDNPQFREQVEWELVAQETADLIVMYFSPSTKSPITLLELGLFTETKRIFNPKLVVCCPDGFWRKGNVDIVCRRYGIKQVNSLKKLGDEIKAFITNGFIG